jgi:hypothetical protein
MNNGSLSPHPEFHLDLYAHMLYKLFPIFKTFSQAWTWGVGEGNSGTSLVWSLDKIEYCWLKSTDT